MAEKNYGWQGNVVDHVNEAGQHVTAATLTFLALCVYIGIAVSSTSDEVLLLGTYIELPLFGVAISLESFYVLAPSLLVFLHVHLLLLQYLLVRKLGDYLDARRRMPRETSDRPFSSLSVLVFLGGDHTRLIRTLFGVLRPLVTVLLPVLLLLLTQYVFVSYHSGWISSWHVLLVVFDLSAIWYFTRINQLSGWTTSGGRRIAVGFLAVFVVASSLLLAMMASGWRCRNLGAFCSLIADVNISLPEYCFAEKEKSRTISLSERDLRGADLSGICLDKADFRGAKLAGARLTRANLPSARFGLAGPLDDSVSNIVPGVSNLKAVEQIRAKSTDRSTCLRGANLRGANLRDANFTLADLQEADLTGAHLEGANFLMANLRGATLRGAYLNGASFEFASLDSSDLRRAEMWAVKFSAASLLGADLSDVSATAADFRWADLRGAKLSDIRAYASDFTEADILGADFQNGQLQGVAGLAIRGADLRGARIGNINLCKGGRQGGAPDTSDFRLIRFEDLAVEKWSEYRAALQEKIRSKTELAEALRRIDQRPMESCLTPDIQGLSVLYYPGDLKEWPSLPEISEHEFQEKLARLLVREACRDQRFGVVLLHDLAGEMTPRRPLLTLAIAKKFFDIIRGDTEVAAVCAGGDSLFKDANSKELIEKIANGNPLLIDDLE